MWSSISQEQPLYNLSGALIFTAYVLSALFLTAFITTSLGVQYKKYSHKRKHGREKHIQTFSALSVLSFSTLSYHMLNYLIVSYQAWSKSHGYQLPGSLFGTNSLLGTREQRVPLHIWSWLTNSTLFADFATTICSNNARFWWTQQALLITMAWSVFMSLEGRRRKIPHLWAYAGISQILPVSFAQNLFFIAMLVSPAAEKDEMVWVPHPMLLLLSLAIYYVFVGLAPYMIGTNAFIGVVIIIRLLLFCPLYLPTIMPSDSGKEYLKARDTQHILRRIIAYVGTCSVVLFVVQTVMTSREIGFNISRVLGAIHDSPAISALGYDYVLSLVSAGFWYSMVGSCLA